MSAGFRSPAGLWVGGVSAPTGTQVGYRSLLAFWAGGAGAVVATPPQPPVMSGGGGSYRPQFRHEPRRIEIDPLQAQRLDEDELIALVIASALPLLH